MFLALKTWLEPPICNFVCWKQNKKRRIHPSVSPPLSHLLLVFLISFFYMSPFVVLPILSPSLNILIATSPPPPYIRSPTLPPSPPP